MAVVSNTTLCCILKRDTQLKKNSSPFSVKGLDINIFLFYTYLKYVKETEKYLVMKLLKHDIQIY